MKLFAFVAGLAAFVVLPATADGQETGSRIGPTPASIPGGRQTQAGARRWMDSFAACVVKRTPHKIEAYLGTSPGSEQASVLGRRLATDECISTGEAQFDDSVLRWAIYEQLYRKQYAKSGPTDFSMTPAIDYAAGGSKADSGQSVALRQFADCVSRASPVQARSLTLSPIGSSVEQAAFTAIMPRLEACLPKTVTLKFSKSVLRGLIAETLYRLSASHHIGARKG
jgi:hypothetical protein